MPNKNGTKSILASVPSLKSLYIKKNLISVNKQITEYNTLKHLLANNVVELFFARRIWPLKDKAPGHKKQWRRMLATSNWDLLNDNKKQFVYKPPQGLRTKSNSYYKKHNMLIIWDFIRKQFRIVSCDIYYVVAFLPLNTFLEKEKFILFYDELHEKYKYSELIKMFDK